MPIIRDIAYGAVSKGASLIEFCNLVGIEPNQLNDSEEVLGFEKSCKTWEIAVRLTGDPLLGLHLGESASPTILGLIGHLMQSSSTLKQAFESVSSFGRLATDMFHYGLTTEKEYDVLTYEPVPAWLKHSPDTAKQATDQAMAGTLHVFQLLCGVKVNVHRAEFVVAKPGKIEEYERVFSSELHFGKKENKLVFKKSELDRAVLSYDRSLFSMFEKMLEGKSRSLSESLVDKVKGKIWTQFRGQVPSLEVLASSMNVTTRTLQRKLREEETTYRLLSDEIRKDIALQLQPGKDTSQSELAEILGYSDARALRRARRRWEG